jgi:thioredoxin 1
MKYVKTLTELQNILNENKLVVLKFSADWCGPCKRIAPEMEKLAEQNCDIAFCHIDVDESSDIAIEYNISAMPTIKFIKECKVAGEIVGADMSTIMKGVEKLKNC